MTLTPKSNLHSNNTAYNRKNSNSSLNEKPSENIPRSQNRYQTPPPSQGVKQSYAQILKSSPSHHSNSNNSVLSTKKKPVHSTPPRPPFMPTFSDFSPDLKKTPPEVGLSYAQILKSPPSHHYNSNGSVLGIKEKKQTTSGDQSQGGKPSYENPPSPQGVSELQTPPPPGGSVWDGSLFGPQEKKGKHTNHQIHYQGVPYNTSFLDNVEISNEQTTRPTVPVKSASGPTISNILKLFPPGTRNIYPISPLMTGDAGHFVAMGLTYPNTHFLLLYPRQDFKDQTRANIERIHAELVFYIHPNRIKSIEVDNPHRTFQQLCPYDPANRREETNYFFRPGQATSNISRYPQSGQVFNAFKGVLDETLRGGQIQTALSTFLYNVLDINNHTSVPKIFIWGRNSGHIKGAHPESDTSLEFFTRVHELISNNPQLSSVSRQIIFVGDAPITHFPSTSEHAFPPESVINMFEFWKKDEFKELAHTFPLIPNPVLQLLLFYKLSSDGHSCLHMSQRSGNFDRLSFALPRETTVFKVLMPENFSHERIDKLNGVFFDIDHMQSPVTPKGRFIKELLERAKYLHKRYGVDTKRLNLALVQTFNQDTILDAFRAIGFLDTRAALNSSLERYELVLKRMLDELHHLDTNKNTLQRDMTKESLDKLDHILFNAIRELNTKASSGRFKTVYHGSQGEKKPSPHIQHTQGRQTTSNSRSNGTNQNSGPKSNHTRC